MTVFLGLDLGTSSVKALLADEGDRVLGEASAPLAVDRPNPLWSEQDPQAWWDAVEAALDALALSRPSRLGDVEAIGLSGQMLGVTLLDRHDRPLRPAIIWSDGRAFQECAEIEAEVADFADRVGSRAMPGFPAPKLRWLRKHEPATLDRARRILLPKDVVRLRLTGEATTDWADGSATLLMDTRRTRWDPNLLDAAGIRADQLPRIAAPTAVTGTVRGEWASRWSLPPGTPVVGGAGDNMCGALGAGVARAGEGCISLGTSGVYALANDSFLPARDGGMHTHRHAVAGLFLQHGCVLSAGAALAWVAGLVRAADIPSLLREVESAAIPASATPVFTPYLSGERTPHDDPSLTGTFSGLTIGTTPLGLVKAVLEGVAMAIGDCHRALLGTGAPIEGLAVIGGGTRSRLWAALIASEIGLPLRVPRSAAFGPALGAARLARASLGGSLVADPGIEDVVLPDSRLADELAAKRPAYRSHLALRAAAPA